jgi:hypothetical protein
MITNYGIARLFLLIFNLTTGYIICGRAQSNCDSSLVKLSSGPSGYRERGDRCEGIYIKEVGSTTLQVASFTESFMQYDLSSGKPLIIQWDAPPNNNSVSLRAQGLRRKLYYQMDKIMPAGKTSYNWPVNFLSSLSIGKSEIGIVGKFLYKSGRVEHNVYVPLRISQQGNDVKTGSYKVLLFPGTELKEVYISMAALEPDGGNGKFIIEGKKLGYGYYPAERAIEIPVSGLKETGIYYLEISAEKKNGGTSTQKIWFYHLKN